ncbi:MAG: MBL fold metallo-hydrolase [Chloroflexi bacterium]|nr:MBL fold metallo-hydrolase [Chloroflexota bacterium]
MEITAGLHRLALGYVNAYLLQDGEGYVLIDAGLPNAVAQIVDYLQQALGRPPHALRAILITHGDYDHVGGLREVQQLSGAPAYGPAAEAAAIGAGRLPESVRYKGWKTAGAWLVARALHFRPGQIDYPVQDGDRLPFAGGLQVIATPGHTAGHLSYFQPQRGILFAGDSVNTRGGRLGTSPQLAPDHTRLLASLRRQAALEPALLCPGHGRPLAGPAAQLRALSSAATAPSG